MERYEYIAPCHFGMEAVLKREIADLGYEITNVEDGKITFAGDAAAMCRANVFLRTTERVLLKVACFTATSFDELFEKTKAVAWEQYIPENGRFWVAKATSIKSTLFSPSDIQSIMKKAMVERLKTVYHKEWFEENGPSYALRVTLMKDVVTIGLDTSGESLHRRGYRLLTAKAPVTETLAAAILLLSPWKADRHLVDPFCGSGTFCIEAAMIATHRAPGMNRDFAAEDWTNLLPRKCWYDAVTEANDLVFPGDGLSIQGYDIDGEIVAAARENARNAEVEEFIHFQERPVAALSHPKKYGFIITNPPYGERLDDKAAMPALYREMGEAFSRLDSWSYYILTGYEEAEHYFGRKADKKRKIYNGMMKTYLLEYMGPKPPRRPVTPEKEN